MRHVEGLRAELAAQGHDVHVFAPEDLPGLRSRLAHRGAEPQLRGVPEWLTTVGGTVAIPANGAHSNLVVTPSGTAALRRELRRHRFDVLHIHEPVAPTLGWDSCSSASATARVGTFHSFNERSSSNAFARMCGGRARLNRLHARIAVSKAAEWTAKRYYGGRYVIVPNGTEVPPERPRRERAADGTLRVLFVGQAVERKGLPVLLRAFEALREHLPVELTLVGVDRETLQPLLNDRSGVRALGRVDDARKLLELQRADVLCAPSLGGESFGMVLTEAFAAGTPVVASDIAGYRDVATKGVDSVLVAPGDPVELALALRDLGDAGSRLEALGNGAWGSAQRFSWSRVADDVVAVYERALDVPEPAGGMERLKLRLGAIPADLGEDVPPQRIPPPDDTPALRRERIRSRLRRGAATVAGLAATAGAVLAVERIGLDRITSALIGSKPSLVVLGLAIMCASMAVRSLAWDAIIRAAMPGSPVTLLQVLRATCIGVLMSATLPARLGEPARAMVISRRAGDPREAFPAVLGTIVSQTILNLGALAVLGLVMLNSVPIFSGRDSALLWVAVVPLALVAVLLVAPVVLARGSEARSERLAQLSGRARFVAAELRSGLKVFRHPRLAVVAGSTQAFAWVLQWLSCYVLLAAMGLDGAAGLGAAAAVLFAVNVTAAVPITPANLGVFQAACVAVLTAGYGVSASAALGYGIVLQAVELATAFIMGIPALLGEGVTWREVRLRTLHSTPVVLPERDSSGAA